MKIQTKPTTNINLGKTWEFDQAVAKNFRTHAQQHIPDYDRVISKCVRFAERNIDQNSKILDFGSATGYTIEKFHSVGFRNLYGIDSSEHMIKHCNSKLAEYICSDQIPGYLKDLDLVLANWTLQFVEDKITVLEQMYRALNIGGYLIVTEKITQDPQLIDLYHAWKRGQGVSDQEIELKQKSLVGVLKIRDHCWWWDNLQAVGFADIQIVNANWCFCTYLCKKK